MKSLEIWLQVMEVAAWQSNVGGHHLLSVGSRVGIGSEAMGRTHLQMPRRNTGIGYQLQVKSAVGRVQEREAADT